MPTHKNIPALNRPTADSSTVEELVARAKRGHIRIPDFQRDLSWKATQVVNLFDSIYKGYPIGSLLLQKKGAPADKINIGPLQIDAPEVYDALWVIDGQHRLASLAAGLAHPNPTPTSRTIHDPYALYFDARTLFFEEPPLDGIIPSEWIPVSQLLNASSLIEWIFKWEHSRDEELRAAVFEAGTRLRQYNIPLYIIETEDESTLREIYTRTNNAGTILNPDQIFKGLFGTSDKKLSTLKGLSDELSLLGLGRPTEKQLIPSLLAFKNLNPTRTITEHHTKDPEILRDAVEESLPTLRKVFSFLRHEAEIPHLRLLPRTYPLAILTRYFSLFPEPNDKAIQLLTRWLWRLLQGATNYDERTILRRGVAQLQKGNAERNALVLLEFVRSELPIELQYRAPDRFDARTSESRLALLGLTSLNPLNLDGSIVNVAELLEKKGVDAFRPIASTSKQNTLFHGPGNRLLLPGQGNARRDLVGLDYAKNEPFFISHGITLDAWTYMCADDMSSFLYERQLIIENATKNLGTRLAAWGRRDRPSIAYMMSTNLFD